MTLTPREKVLARIADHLVGTEVDHPLRVAVDGVTAAGKSTFAGELTDAVAARGRSALHLSTDDFHHQRAHRHRQSDQAAGYYEDAYDFDLVARLVLVPLGQDGDGRFRRRSHDLASDALIDEPPQTAAPDAIVIVDGSFLQRPALADLWDVVIFLDTDLQVARARGSRRDAELFGDAAAAEEAFRLRYHAACQLYVDDVSPRSRASVVVDNNILDRPILRRIGGVAAD